MTDDALDPAADDATAAGRAPRDGPDLVQVLTTSGRRGAETYAVALGQALATRCHRVRTVALEPGPPPTLLVPALATHRRSVAGLRALRRLLATTEVAVAHGSTSLPATALATAGGGPPFIYRVIGEPGAWTTTRSRRARTSALLRRAAAVAVYHRAAADAVVALHSLDPARVHVLAKGIDLAAWRPGDAEERRDARRALDLPDDAPVVAWVGALATEKRPELAVAAAMAVPGAHLLVAGDGPLADRVAAAAAPHGGRVHLLGRLRDAGAVYRAADVALLTSATEGVPGAVLEPQACGVPVVAVDVGGVAEVVDDGTTGRVVGDHDPATLTAALVDVLADPTPMGVAARARVVECFDLDRVADGWVALLAEVAERGSPTSGR